jgi:hypothetical protein
MGKPECDTCNDTGQICTGSSGQDWDGNAPVLERCPECGYGDARTHLEVQVAQFEADMRKALGWADHHFLRRDREYALTITQGAWSGWITATRAQEPPGEPSRKD